MTYEQQQTLRFLKALHGDCVAKIGGLFDSAWNRETAEKVGKIISKFNNEKGNHHG